MDELSDVLSGILNDPESMEKVKSMAEKLLGEKEEKDENAVNEQELKRILSVVSSLKAKKDDKRTALLLALKPNLSPEKQKKVDTAIKLIRFIEILPTLKESGILNIL